MAMNTKFIFVTGGVVSGLGKGITAASLGRLLKQRGLRVKVQKLDPYLNVDPGTMSPYQHGEVFVTDDGAETDLDLGHYERFIDENLTFNSSVSSGKVYWNVLNRERRGDYLGGTVQIIPHITNEIKANIYSLEGPDTDVAIVEIGGTVGDIESQPFLEAIRQVAAERGRQDVMFIHVSLIVSIPGSGELKSKPTQHSAKELLSLGIQPDILVRFLVVVHSLLEGTDDVGTVPHHLPAMLGDQAVIEGDPVIDRAFDGIQDINPDACLDAGHLQPADQRLLCAVTIGFRHLPPRLRPPDKIHKRLLQLLRVQPLLAVVFIQDNHLPESLCEPRKGKRMSRLRASEIDPNGCVYDFVILQPVLCNQVILHMIRELLVDQAVRSYPKAQDKTLVEYAANRPGTLIPLFD